MKKLLLILVLFLFLSQTSQAQMSLYSSGYDTLLFEDYQGYVPDPALRLRLYRRMSTLDSLAEIDAMAEELADRFGPIPDPANNLLYQLRVKALALKAGVPAVTTEAGQIKIRIPEPVSKNRFHLQRMLGSSVRVSKTAIWMPRDIGTHEWQVVLVQVLEKLQSVE